MSKGYHALSSAAALLNKQAKKGTRSWSRALPSFETPMDAMADSPARLEVDPAHMKPLGTWSAEQMEKSRAENPFLMTWVPGKARENVPLLTHGHGVYVYDNTGKQYIDWTSMAVCNNIGHSIPKQVVDAVAQQMSTLSFTFGGIGVTEVRVRLNQLLGELLPGDLRPAVYPSSGAEANEAGIMMARRFTGRHKVMSWYRSYHGATASASAATGDFRRWYGSDMNPGFVKAFNPFPLFFDHGGRGATEEERVESALAMLEEQILNEGPHNIASIMIESVVGAGGCLVMPPGYMQGVRAICDQYGILMHVDEVMVGFGRTGKLFGFENYDGVIPDIVVAGKGLAGATVPLSMMACNTELMEHFEEIPLGWGSTYQAHPVALAAAYENLKYFISEDVLGNVQRIAPLFERHMQELESKHGCIKQYRAIGLFGCFDVQDPNGANPKLQHEPPVNPEAFAAYKKAYAEAGLVGLHRYPHIHSAPPLVINEEELADGFDRLDQALTVLNRSLGH